MFNHFHESSCKIIISKPKSTLKSFGNIMWCSISRKWSSRNSTTKNHVPKHNVHMTEITWPRITWSHDVGLVHDHVIYKLFENLLLIHLHLFEVDQKWISNSLKMDPKRCSITWSLISGGNSGGFICEIACICLTWPSHPISEPKIGPSHITRVFILILTRWRS